MNPKYWLPPIFFLFYLIPYILFTTISEGTQVEIRDNSIFSSIILFVIIGYVLIWVSYYKEKERKDIYKISLFNVVLIACTIFGIYNTLFILSWTLDNFDAIVISFAQLYFVIFFFLGKDIVFRDITRRYGGFITPYLIRESEANDLNNQITPKVSSENKQITVLDIIFGAMASLALTTALNKYSMSLSIFDVTVINTVVLLTFFLTAIPFYHKGIIFLRNRDISGHLRSPTTIFFHFFSLIGQAAILFFMAVNVTVLSIPNENENPVRTDLFLISFLVFMTVDVVWSLIEQRVMKIISVPPHWAYLGIFTILFLFGSIMYLRATEFESEYQYQVVFITLLFITLLRTIIDYSVGWDIYSKGFGIQRTSTST